MYKMCLTCFQQEVINIPIKRLLLDLDPIKLNFRNPCLSIYTHILLHKFLKYNMYYLYACARRLLIYSFPSTYVIYILPMYARIYIYI